MIQLKAKDFNTRKDLESEVQKSIGLTSDIKEGYEIVGKDEELVRLGLSRKTTFYGIRCASSTKEEKKEVFNKPERGEFFQFGINGNVKKKK